MAAFSEKTVFINNLIKTRILVIFRVFCTKESYLISEVQQILARRAISDKTVNSVLNRDAGQSDVTVLTVYDPFMDTTGTPRGNTF